MHFRLHPGPEPIPFARAAALAAVIGSLFLSAAACDESRPAPDLPAAAAGAGEEAGTAPASLDPAYESEIEALAARDDVQRAIQEIDAIQDASIEDLIWLTEIPAPPFMEEERAEAYAGMLREAGADSVWIDEVGNVLALRRGTEGGRTVALDGHLDTVFPPEVEIQVVQRGDTLFAPGIGDDTRGLIAVRNVLHALVVADIRTPDDLLFIGTVGEEGLGDLRGVKHLFGEQGPGIDSWIAIDGGDERRVKVESVGSHRYRVTFLGPGGHSWGAFGLVNPQHAMGTAIDAWVRRADPYIDEAAARTSYNVGRTGGGTSVNSIPYEAWMEVDMRSLDQESLLGMDALFQEAVLEGLEAQNELRRRGDSLRVDVDMVGDRPAGTADVSSPLIQRAKAATRFVGAEPNLGSGSTNSNTPMSLGIPATTIGRGGQGGGAHSLDEWWLPVNPELADRKALLLLLAEAGLRGPE